MFRGTLSYKALCGFYKSLQLADMMQTIENLVECAIVSDETM
jgi:putative component of toxin-antitoxin plasmid stabilization module